MKPLYLIAQDLYSYELLNLDFKPYYNGTTMILGKNLDMNSANGAGKSAILRLMYLALFGKDLKGVAYEKIVREGSTGGSLVAYSFEDSGSVFRIIRWKSFKKATCPLTLCNGKIPSGNGVEFSVDGIAFNVEKDNDAVEEMINSKIGMNGKVFLNSILTQQKKDNNFLEQSDSEKKELLSNIFDLDFYEKALKIVKSDIIRLEEQIAVSKNKKEIYEKQLESESLSILSLEKRITDEKENKKNRASELTTEILKLNKEIISLNEELNSVQALDLTSISATLSAESNKKNKLEKDLAVEGELIKNRSEKEQALKTLLEYQNKFSADLIVLKEKENKMTTELADLPQPTDIVVLKEEISKLESSLAPKLTKISSFKLTLKQEMKLTQDKGAAESKITQLEKDITKINLDLNQIEDEAKCNECHRAFKEGESSVLDELLTTKRKSKEQVLSTLNSLQVQLAQLNVAIGELAVVKEQITQEEAEVLSLQESINKIKIKYEQETSLAKQVQMRQNQIGELSERINKIVEDLDKIEKKKVQTSSYLKNLEPLFQDLEKIKVDYATQTKRVNDLSLEVNSLELKNKNFENLQNSYKDKSNYLENLKKELANINNNSSPLVDVLDSTKEKRVDLVKDIQELNEKLDQYYDQIKYLNFWEIGFSKTGIRSFILDDIINILNFRTKENLDILSDRTLALMFQPEHKSQKGVTSNKISTLMYVNGVERVFELNSGGEAQRLTLAVDLALSDIAESRAGSNFNMKFLDEPFDGIDTNGQIKALALFNKLAQTRNGFFLISHDKEMQAFCDNTIYIVKENGISRLVDKEAFMQVDSPAVEMG